MITQKIRVLNNEVTTCYFNTLKLFSNMELYSISTIPSWCVESTPGGSYIRNIELSPTAIETAYIYYTLGVTSPPSEDAMLIIEVVDSLTDDSDTCAKSQTVLVDSINDRDGYARVNLIAELDSYPKVGEYVYINNTIYSGYTMVKNIVSNQNIVIDIPYAGSLTPVGCYLTYFGANTSKCLVWINREGGRSSYTFDQRKDTEGIVGDSKTFDNNGVIKYVNRGKNKEYITVYKTGLSNTEVDLIESLRYSIQAWEYDINTNTSYEIDLDSNNFSKYSSKSKLNEIQIKYKYSRYKTIQNQ